MFITKQNIEKFIKLELLKNDDADGREGGTTGRCKSR